MSTRNGEITGAQVVRKQRFMYSALGYWPSLVNPTRENLLYKNGVDSCFLLKDEFDKIVDFYCPVFDQLWRIRFKAHPFDQGLYGWGQGEFKPSEAQLAYLSQQYGIHNLLTDYIYGEHLYKLLRDIQNNSWVQNYKSITAP